MPLTDALPVIDDRKYDDLVAELRTRIARYTPEWKPVWSDLNDSDPGITLAQLFAWLSEMMLYRMNRVPQLNYIKFLQLIGIELAPALPARAEIAFTVAPTWNQASVLVPPRVQVSATGDDGKPVVFETERALTALACTLQAVQSYDAAAYSDLTAANAVYSDPDVANASAESGSAFAPFSDLPRDDCALLLGLGFPAGHLNFDTFPSLTLDFAVTAADDPQQGRSVDCGPASTRAYASARLQWEGWDGALWQALDALSDETLALTRSGHLLVRVPANVKLARAFIGTYDALDPLTKQPRPPLFWLRARLVRTQFERTPRLRAIRTNTVPALQAQTVLNEVLGGSSGARHQTFQLDNQPVIKGSLTVTIDDGTAGGPRAWATVDDLIGAAPTDEVLAVNWTSGEVRAGDGEHGQIPVANAANPDTNVIATTYRFGGGKRGNVGAGKLTTLLTSITGIDAGKTSNLFAAAGGTDEETLDDAQRRAQRSLRARDRAVSIEDIELLAQQAGNVRRAKALPLAHPQFPGVKVPGAVSVIVVPDSDALPPLPSDGLLQTVCAYLNARRLLTTELYVVAPRFVLVEVRAQVVVLDGADTAAVKLAVEQALDAYLNPLTGGDDGQGWPFGGALRYSKVVQRVFSVAGVDSVPSLALVVDGEDQPECRDVSIDAHAPNALVYSTGHELDVLSQREAGETA